MRISVIDGRFIVTVRQARLFLQLSNIDVGELQRYAFGQVDLFEICGDKECQAFIRRTEAGCEVSSGHLSISLLSRDNRRFVETLLRETLKLGGNYEKEAPSVVEAGQPAATAGGESVWYDDEGDDDEGDDDECCAQAPAANDVAPLRPPQ